MAMLPSNQGDIKNAAVKPGQHQKCCHQTRATSDMDSFDLRCESVTYTFDLYKNLAFSESLKGLYYFVLIDFSLLWLQ